jgi:16S rRNA (cytosine1402-N4)-methyltransferase
MEFHTPVLLSEVIKGLSVTEDGTYVDATLGHGGHTIEILKLGGEVYGFDQDPKNLEIATKRITDLGLSQKFHPIHSNFNQLELVFKQQIKNKIDGLLADLGLSQSQQTAENRGFSFNDSQSIDMRLDPDSQDLTAEEIINTYSFDDLYQIFTKYSQELYSKPLILKIIRERQKSPIKSGQRLADIIKNYYQEHHISSRINPATKIFMSLRIAVNDEFKNLSELLQQSLSVVKPGGTTAIITFHSGEDRIVKNFISDHKTQVIPTKSIKPNFSETKINPLSRSSTLRLYKIV